MLFSPNNTRKAILVFFIISMKTPLIAGGDDYEDDAYPDEDRRISRESMSSHQPVGMKTSTVIKISPEEGTVAESSSDSESTTMTNRNDRNVQTKLKKKIHQQSKEIEEIGKNDVNVQNKLKSKIHQQSKEIKEIEKTVNSLEKELGKEISREDKKVKVLHTPNTKLKSPEVTEIRAPKLQRKNGKEKTILKQKLPQKPSRVVVDVKEKKDNENGKKKWETDLVVEGKPKKSGTEDKIVEVNSNPSSTEEKEIIKVNPETGETKDILKVSPKSSETKDIIKINQKTGEAKEVVKIKPETDETKEIIEVKPEPEETEEIIETKPSTDEVITEDSETNNVVDIVETKDSRDSEVVEVEEVNTKGGKLLVQPDVIDVDNIGTKPKVAVAVQENNEKILNTIMDGLRPNLVRWAEQAIAAGMENVVNAVEDKYIAYMTTTSQQRSKRAAHRPRKHTGKALMKSAIKKVQSAAAKLAANEAETAAKQASTAAKLNMDVTNEVANNALKSVASAISGASKDAAQKVVDAQNRAAAEALAGAALQAPLVIEPPPLPSPVSLDQLAAGGGAGKDLIQQTLQIQKGLNLVMRAVLKEKERVASDLARYQHKISFLLREMSGAPVEVISTGKGGKPGVELVVERSRRRRRRAVLSARHLRQLLHDEQRKLDHMLHSLDVTLASQPGIKRKREWTDVCARPAHHSGVDSCA